MAGKNYINRLVDGDVRAFDEIYYAYKRLFVGFFRKNYRSYRFDVEGAQDLYHRALAALYNNVQTGRIKRDGLPDDKLKAYIIKVGKLISLNDYRKVQTPLTFDTDAVMRIDIRKHMVEFCLDELYNEETDEKLAIVRAVVQDMKKPCSQLLQLAVYQRKSHEEIALIMNYADARSVTTQRFRCMEKLKRVAKKRLKDAGYEY